MLKDGVTFMVSMLTLYPAAACPTSDVVDDFTLHVKKSATNAGALMSVSLLSVDLI